MTFDYFIEVKSNSQLSIEDIGNTAIAAYTDLGFQYILIIHTEYGSTKVLEYGPNIVDTDVVPESVDYKYVRFDFSESRIIRIIERFLLTKAKITQAFEIPFDEAVSYIKDARDIIC